LWKGTASAGAVECRRKARALQFEKLGREPQAQALTETKRFIAALKALRHPKAVFQQAV
jgi:hypothetical protein